MKRVLITGGAGFIGSNLALKLLSKGYQVRILDNLSHQIHGEYPDNTSPLYTSIKNKVEFILGDVANRTELERAIQDQDAVIHFAAETGTGQSMYEIKRYSDVNIGGTALLLDILTNKKHNVEKLVIASSRAIYGEGRYFCSEHDVVYPELRRDDEMTKGRFECKCPICSKTVKLLATNEESKIHSTSIYGITKHTQEQMALAVGNAIELPTVVLRYQNVYGPGQSLSNPYTGILSIFSSLIRNGKNINIFEDGLESRDFVYIDDVVDATVLGLQKSEANFEVFNVGSGIPTSVKYVAETLKNLYGSNTRINVTGNYRKGDIRHNFSDNTKINNRLKFNPKIQFSEGILRFCSWVEQQEIVVDSYDKSIKELERKGLFK